MFTKSRSLLSIEATAATLEKLVDALSNSQKYTILTVVDIGLFLTSICLAIGCERGFGSGSLADIWQNVDLILPKMAISLGGFWLLGVYHQVLRYSGSHFLLAVAKATLVSSLVLAAVVKLYLDPTVPMSVLVDDGLLTLVLTISFRLGARLTLRKLRQVEYPEAKCGVIIYGAGSAGCILARAVRGEYGKQLIGFVDDNPCLQGRKVQGTQVYSPAELSILKEKVGFEEILLAMPSLEGRRKSDILQELQVLGVSVKTVPSITEILSGEISVNRVRHVDAEDLLGRKAIAARPELLQHDITNRVVLVTGGGGSIGSELCRQIAKQHPKLLIVYELHEFALYQMDMELAEEYPEVAKVACLGSVTDPKTLSQVLDKYSVETIYHAAAYKHVPIVEANPISGAINNIGGTLTAAQCAIACGVRKFVLISTDKAVRPTNIMGATKRAAELVLQGLADLPHHQTCFTMVRFGNVLGSSGSVVPRFRDQIGAGKPLTVTHADITRYFMTIPEAAGLVIQAGAMAKGGEVFLLDMGEPVKILDLAIQIIRLHGLEPHEDVKIEITGLRPGEKIHEELLIDCHAAMPTGHAKIFCAHEAKLSWSELSYQLTNLLEAAAQNNVAECVSVLRNLVPEYQPMGQYAKVKARQLEQLAIK